MGCRQCNAYQGMEAGMSEVEEFIEQYKRELVAEAELARDDLREIEDHLRTLTAELRESGMSSVDAVRMACERLGDPRAVAREHAKMGSQFGERLSWARTISAALLLLTFVVSNCVGMWMVLNPPAGSLASQISPFAVILALGTMVLWIALVAALFARRSWARAIAVGSAVFELIEMIAPWPTPTALALLVPVAGALLFIMPWRRRELRRAGYAIALQAFAFGVMFSTARIFGSHRQGPGFETLIGILPTLVAIVGSVIRARWTSLASMFGAAALSVSVVEVVRYDIAFRHNEYVNDWLPLASMVFAGVLASSIAAVLSWRSTRPTAGSLRYMLR